MSAAPQPGLARRAAFALLGQLGFYGLGLGLILGLLAIPWAQARYQNGPDPLGLLAVGLAFFVGRAMLPPWRKRNIAGLLLKRDDQPRLFALLDRVSREVGVPLPEEIWLVPEANAFIGRTGTLRRRRRMGLGFGLMQILDQDELASVIGHELGHARGGDVALGPWVLGTREAIHVALDRLDSEGAGLHLPFQWYGRWYLRASLAVGRAQEHAADHVAASVAGPEAAGRALQRIHDQGPLWGAYWREEVVPMVERGRLPPLAEGFRRFLSAPRVEEIAARLAVSEREAQTQQEDSHPALRDRLDAIGATVGSPAPPPVESLACTLLEGEVEPRLIHALMVGEVTLTPIAWDRVGPELRVPVLKAELQPYASKLSSLQAAGLGEALDAPERWLSLLRGQGPRMLSEEAERRRLSAIFAAHLTLILARAGWNIVDLPGEPVTALRDDHRIEPFAELAALVADPAKRAAWRERVTAWGL